MTYPLTTRYILKQHSFLRHSVNECICFDLFASSHAVFLAFYIKPFAKHILRHFRFICINFIRFWNCMDAFIPVVNLDAHSKENSIFEFNEHSNISELWWRRTISKSLFEIVELEFQLISIWKWAHFVYMNVLYVRIGHLMNALPFDISSFQQTPWIENISVIYIRFFQTFQYLQLEMD